MPYAGTSPRLLNADAAVLETARTQYEAFRAAIEKLKEKAALRDTQDSLSDFLDGLYDLHADDISAPLSAIEFELGNVERLRAAE